MKMILLDVEVEAWPFSTLMMALCFRNKDSHIKPTGAEAVYRI